MTLSVGRYLAPAARVMVGKNNLQIRQHRRMSDSVLDVGKEKQRERETSLVCGRLCPEGYDEMISSRGGRRKLLLLTKVDHVVGR